MENTDFKRNDDVTVIKPKSGWSMFDFSELWAYRELIWVMVMKDIKVRYKQTVMGVAWAVIQPLTMMVIFSLIFGRLAKIPSDGYPYPIFVFSGLLAWNFFSSSVGTAGGSLVGSQSLISKVYFPRIIVPLSSIGVAMVDFLIASTILLAMMVHYGQALSAKLLLLPCFLAGLIMVSVGLGSWLAAVTVTYRDFRYVIPYMLQVWMYLTPVIYPLSFLSESWRWVMHFNPMYAWIDGVRACFLGLPIDLFGVAVSTVVTLIIFVVGLCYFARAERRFADII